jgi:HlyD family secretion protein
VKAGDLLVKLDPSPFEEEIRQLSAEVSGLEAALESLTQALEWEKNQAVREVRTAQYNLKVAYLERRKLEEGDGPLQLAQYREELQSTREEYDRHVSYTQALEKISREGFSGNAELKLAHKKILELEEKKAAAEKKFLSYRDHVLPTLREKATAAVENAQAVLEQTRKGGGYQVAKSSAALKETAGRLEATRAELAQMQAELERTIIRAPFGGIAILFEAFRDGRKRKPRVGDRVWQNQPLLYLPDISSMVVKTQIREVDLHKIRIGQECTVRIDAYPQHLLAGEVSFVGVLAAERIASGMGGKYFQLTVSLQKNDPRLRPGMTSRVSILTSRAQNAFSVPIQAIFDEGGEKYCYRIDGESFRKVPVVLGVQNEDLAEIRSGLAPGDRVSLVRPRANASP